MQPTQFSSGDVIADRRADYARMLAESGDPAAAAELMEQALELAPAWAAGWLRLRWLYSALLLWIGKGLRYAVVLWLVQ